MQKYKKTRVENPGIKKIAGAAVILLFFGLAAALFFTVGQPLVRFLSEPELFRAWVDAHGAWGRLAFVGMVALQVIVAVIPGEPFEIGAGYAFGLWEGTALCLLGETLGTLAVFLFVRRFGTRAVELFFPLEKLRELKFLKNTKKLHLMTFLVFFIPGSPKDVLTYFLGLTEMKLLPCLLLTGLGRIPAVITSTIGGDALGLQNYQFAILVFAVTVVISLAGLLVFRRLCRREENS